MKEIVLKSLSLKNFKGIKNLSIAFNKTTSIFGDNGTGKTTIADAFTWIMFDKDSQDRGKFNVQPLDGDNNVIHMLETEVTAVMTVDNTKVTLRKILKEKWVKKRGEVNSELKGTETSYYVDEVPFKQGEYQKKIASIIPENIFKLVTNPLYFSSTMKWQDRRNIIFELNGDVTIENVIKSNDKLKELSTLLNPNEDIETFIKRVNAQKKKLKDDKESIPARVDELNKTLREDIDFEALEFRKRSVKDEITSIEEKLLDSSKVNEETLKLKGELNSLRFKLKDIEFNVKFVSEKPLEHMQNSLRNKEYELPSIQRNIKNVQSYIDITGKQALELEQEMAQLREKWTIENEREIDIPHDDYFVCPTCKRALETEDIESQKLELMGNFNKNKANKLIEISSMGKAKKEKVDTLQIELKNHLEEIEELKNKEKDIIDEIEKLKEDINNFKPSLNFETNKEYQETLEEIQKLEREITQTIETSGETEKLKIKKKDLERDLEDINKQFSYKEQNESIKTRITDLKNKESELAQKIAELEGQEFLCEEFIKSKVNLLESSINEKFSYVKFKLFDVQVNGGIAECCEVLVNGVPFTTNLNSAARINGGIDIINTLSKHYGVEAPIFIDNKESVTRLIDTDNQIINLIVSEEDKKLRIESEVL